MSGNATRCFSIAVLAAHPLVLGEYAQPFRVFLLALKTSERYAYISKGNMERMTYTQVTRDHSGYSSIADTSLVNSKKQ